MRFAGAVVPGDQVLTSSNLFTAAVRVDASGQVIQESLGGR